MSTFLRAVAIILAIIGIVAAANSPIIESSLEVVGTDVVTAKFYVSKYEIYADDRLITWDYYPAEYNPSNYATIAGVLMFISFFALLHPKQSYRAAGALLYMLGALIIVGAVYAAPGHLEAVIASKILSLLDAELVRITSSFSIGAGLLALGTLAAIGLASEER